MIEIINQQKKFFQTNQTKSYTFRRMQLIKLRDAMIAYEDQLKEALFEDLHKSSFESYTTEIGFTLHSIRHTLKHLHKWMKPKKKKTPIFMLGSKSYVMSEPYGQTLIIGPYNYPIQLVLEPLVGAIAAGNTVIIKPSEFTKATEKVLVDLISSTFDPSYIKIMTGDYKVTASLLEHKFDYIFFTGSTKVGQIVYEQASKHLTPVTLELGGKSPTIIDETADLKKAAASISFGKFLNAGQTCIAPDYIYVHKNVHDQFLELLKKAIDKQYTKIDDMGYIVNDRHFHRLQNLISLDKVVYGNSSNEHKRFISPTILDRVTWHDNVMKEEIFGPILPILVYEELDELIDLLKTKEKPLALYLFTKQKAVIKKVFNQLSFGGGAVNDTIMHVSNPYIPFGGVGTSGIGSYHGQTSFNIFSHQKSYIKSTTLFKMTLGYPPYSDKKEKLVKKVLK
ncbi:aldehyde dehydrogenase [Mycoplasmatota bacterium]|nr:aldehyde dehydrogenase [Mycoplasmatota bacterium]